jgi:hypothetical protein
MASRHPDGSLSNCYRGLGQGEKEGGKHTGGMSLYMAGDSIKNDCRLYGEFGGAGRGEGGGDGINLGTGFR